MTDNSFTTNPRPANRIKSLVYSVFILTLIVSAVYFFASPNETAKAKKSKAPAFVLATTTFPTTTTLPAPITDNTPAGINLSIPVSGLTDEVRGVALNITADQPAGGGGHTWIGDLNMTLFAPGGTPSHLIIQRIGSTSGTGSGDSTDFQGPYTFTDGTTGDIWTEAANMVGGTVPAGSYRTLACCSGSTAGPGIFTDMNPVFQGPALADTGFDFKKDSKKTSDVPIENVGNGTWQLNISDNAGGDTGRISQLSLTITTLAPTAATAVIRGRVLTPGGQGIGRANVTIINTSTQDSFVVMTNQFGYFIATDLPIGDVYTMTVEHKQYEFPVPTQAFTLDRDVDDALFISQ